MKLFVELAAGKFPEGILLNFELFPDFFDCSEVTAASEIKGALKHGFGLVHDVPQYPDDKGLYDLSTPE